MWNSVPELGNTVLNSLLCRIYLYGPYGGSEAYNWSVHNCIRKVLYLMPIVLYVIF